MGYIDMANWKRLKAHFGTASNANGKQHAQARMVMLQFPLARLPYRYELCPLDNGEVTIARRLAKHSLQETIWYCWTLVFGVTASFGISRIVGRSSRWP